MPPTPSATGDRIQPDRTAVQGEVSLILLPGLDGTGVTFWPLLKHLPAFVRPTVVAYPTDRALGYPELLALVTEMLPGKPFYLLGESFASPLAIMIAAGRPSGLRGLILSAGFARNPLWGAPTWLASFAHPLIFRFYPAYVRFKVRRRGGGPAGRARLAALTEHTPRIIANRIRSVLRVNVMPQLSHCPVPVLYVRGVRDRLIAARNLSEMSRCLPSMRVARLDGGHCLLRSRPELAAAAIVEFIADCSRPAAHRQVMQPDLTARPS